VENSRSFWEREKRNIPLINLHLFQNLFPIGGKKGWGVKLQRRKDRLLILVLQEKTMCYRRSEYLLGNLKGRGCKSGVGGGKNRSKFFRKNAVRKGRSSL